MLDVCPLYYLSKKKKKCLSPLLLLLILKTLLCSGENIVYSTQLHFFYFFMYIGIVELHYHLLRRHYRNYILYFIQILSYCVPNVGVSVEMS